MKNINTVTISGNLTRDAEHRDHEKAPVVFSVAVNDQVPGGKGYEDYVSFIDCVIFGAYGRALEPYLSKGTKVAISGHLRQDRWEDAKGKHSRVVLIVDQVDICSKREASKYSEPVPFE